MGWRPKDWEDIITITQNRIAKEWEGTTGSFILRQGIEAGADAMLQALKEKGIYLSAQEASDVTKDMVTKLVEDKTWIKEFLSKPSNAGWLVKIPDKEA